MILRLFVFFVLLLSIFHGEVDGVKLHISGNLECFRPQFKYQVSVKDFDWHSSNDRLYTSPFYKSFYPHHYSADTEDNDVDELENDMYEIMVSFLHTCTNDGKWLYYESRVGYVSNSIAKAVLVHNVNLTNAQGKLSWRDWQDWSSSNSFF